MSQPQIIQKTKIVQKRNLHFFAKTFGKGTLWMRVVAVAHVEEPVYVEEVYALKKLYTLKKLYRLKM